MEFSETMSQVVAQRFPNEAPSLQLKPKVATDWLFKQMRVTPAGDGFGSPRTLFECGAHPSAVICVSVHLNKVIPLPHFSTQECPCSLHSSSCRAGQPDYDLFRFPI